MNIEIKVDTKMLFLLYLLGKIPKSDIDCDIPEIRFQDTGIVPPCMKNNSKNE